MLAADDASSEAKRAVLEGDDTEPEPNSLSLLSFRNEQEIGFAGCKVKSDYFAACFFNQLPNSRFAILRFG